MTRQKFQTFFRFLIPAAALLAMAATLWAAVRIGGSSFKVNGQLARGHRYAGACPVDLTFDWGVIGSHPETVTYTVERSDGGQGRPRSVRLPGGNRSVPVLEHWRLGGNSPQFRNFSGWVQLMIQSPEAASNRISFTIHCR